MKQKKLKQLVSDMQKLEKECQDGNNVADNMKKMAEIFESLSLEDMLLLAVSLEELN